MFGEKTYSARETKRNEDQASYCPNFSVRIMYFISCALITSVGNVFLTHFDASVRNAFVTPLNTGGGGLFYTYLPKSDVYIFKK